MSEFVSTLTLNTRNGSSKQVWDTSWNIRSQLLNSIGAFSLCPVSVRFPNTVYPINENNQYIYFNDGSLRTAVLEPNNYTGTQFAAHVAAQMTAVSAGTVTVTYDSQAKKLSFSASLNFTFVSGDLTCYEEMGLDETLFTTIVSPAVKVGDYPVNLTGSHSVKVLTSFSSFGYSTEDHQNVLFDVPVSAEFGEIVFYQEAFPQNLTCSNDHIETLFMQLRDDKGNIYRLPDNAHVTIKLLIKHLQKEYQPRISLYNDEMPHPKRLRDE